MNKINNISNTSLPASQGGSPVVSRFVFVAKIALLFLAAAYIAHQTGIYNQFRDWLTRRGFLPGRSGPALGMGTPTGGTTPLTFPSEPSSSGPSQTPRAKTSSEPWPDLELARLASKFTLEGLVDPSKLQPGENGIPLLNEAREFFELVQRESDLDRAEKVGRRQIEVEPLPIPNEWLRFHVTTPGDLFNPTVIKPVTLEVKTEFVGGRQVEIAASEGRKSQMEDRHIVMTIQLEGYPTMTLVGVFDGHRDSFGFGEQEQNAIVAEFIQDSIVEYFENELTTIEPQGELATSEELLYAKIICALKNSMIKIDEAYLRKGRWMERTWGHGGYGFAAPHNGSTALVAIIVNDQIITANLGDSRAILVRQESPIPLTIDATLTDEKCRLKIKTFGGSVEQSGRVASLSGQRLIKAAAIGDHMYRPNGIRKCVLNEPEVSIAPYAQGDRLVVASAGIWQAVSSNRAAGIVSRTSAEGAAVPNSVGRASSLANLAFRTHGQQENGTVAVVSL